MSLAAIIMSVLVYFWHLFISWIYLFYAPFTLFEALWTIIPIWLAWFFTEFFEEKKGTSFGHIIRNGVVPTWVGIDWLRQVTNSLVVQKVAVTDVILAKYVFSFFVLVYGSMIIIFGIEAKKFVTYFGRIREVTYILVILTPFIYGIVPPSFDYIISSIIFAPVFYYLIELIDYITPTPKIFEEESSEPSFK